MRECLVAAASRLMATVLSKSANNGERDSRKQKKTRGFDAACVDLPLHGRAGGTQQEKDREKKKQKHAQPLSNLSNMQQ
jgi:hypothetical protein